jgi:hypothetical protein
MLIGAGLGALYGGLRRANRKRLATGLMFISLGMFAQFLLSQSDWGLVRTWAGWLLAMNVVLLTVTAAVAWRLHYLGLQKLSGETDARRQTKGYSAGIGCLLEVSCFPIGWSFFIVLTILCGQLGSAVWGRLGIILGELAGLILADLMMGLALYDFTSLQSTTDSRPLSPLRAWAWPLLLGLLSQIGLLWLMMGDTSLHVVRYFTVPEGPISAVAIARQGRLAMFAGRDGTVQLWDMEQGVVVRSFTGHTAKGLRIAISPDGRQAVTEGAFGIVRLWEIDTGEVRRLNVHGLSVRCIAFSPDGSQVLLGGAGPTLYLCDVKTGKELHRFDSPPGEVKEVAFVAGGWRCLSWEADNGIRLWNMDNGEVWRSDAPAKCHDLAFSPDGASFATGHGDWTVRLWDMETGKQQRCLEGHRGPVEQVEWSADGRWLLSVGADNTIRCWDVTTGRQRAIYRFGGLGQGYLRIAVASGAPVAVGVERDGQARWFELPEE